MWILGLKGLNRSGSVARQSRQVFKEREGYKTYKYKTDIEGIYFSMYYSRLQVYILVARRLGGSSVEVIQFSGSTARWLVSRDYRATEPPQRIYLENLPCILQLSLNFPPGLTPGQYCEKHSFSYSTVNSAVVLGRLRNSTIHHPQSALIFVQTPCKKFCMPPIGVFVHTVPALLQKGDQTFEKLIYFDQKPS